MAGRWMPRSTGPPFAAAGPRQQPSRGDTYTPSARVGGSTGRPGHHAGPFFSAIRYRHHHGFRPRKGRWPAKGRWRLFPRRQWNVPCPPRFIFVRMPQSNALPDRSERDVRVSTIFCHSIALSSAAIADIGCVAIIRRWTNPASGAGSDITTYLSIHRRG